MNYKTWHDYVGKMFHRELCKKLKFDHTARWFMYKTEFVLEKETHIIPWDFPNRGHFLLGRSQNSKQRKGKQRWRWWLYQMSLIYLEWSPKTFWEGWWSGKSEDERRSSKLQYCWGRPEYWDESLRIEEICCHLASSIRPTGNAGM